MCFFFCLILMSVFAFSSQIIYRAPLDLGNSGGPQSSPSSMDRSSAILMQYGPRHDPSNLSHSEALQNSQNLTGPGIEPLLFFWDARPKLGFSNFGDALSEALTERMVGHKIKVAEQGYEGFKKLLGMGSILSYAQDHDVIWGTGVNGKIPDHAYHFTTLDVRAVRGPLTREFLLKRKIACPEIYGDPTLLLPFYFPEIQKPLAPTNEYILIPHYSDEHLFAHLPHVVSVKEPWDVVVTKILDSKFVISSALSGIIVAEAYGIPARLLQIENTLSTEDLLKYKDYYFGTNRFDFTYATSVEQALEMGGEPLPKCDLEILKNAFPFELFVGIK